MISLLRQLLAAILSFLLALSAFSNSYNANDQLSTDTYGLGYVYDFENHLVQANGIAYVYDGDGNRVSKTVAGVTTTYVVDTFNPTGYAQVVTETVSGTSPQSYVYGLERIAHFRQFYNQGWVYENVYYVYDGHGSVRALTDATGTVTSQSPGWQSSHPMASRADQLTQVGCSSQPALGSNTLELTGEGASTFTTTSVPTDSILH